MRCCWSWTTTTWSTLARCTSRSRSCWRTCRRACCWWCPAGLTRRCRWRGCGPAASWLSCAPPSSASPPRRRGRTDAAGFVAAFSGSHRFVLDYLADEVLDGQPGPVRAFLLETSVLERLSGELCDAVTGRPGSQALLQDIEQAGLFLVPLDEVRGWWRYHHLFADLLRARLEQERPGRVVPLHRAAAAWCADHGLPGDAVRHALAAGDQAWAARLVERYADAFLLRSEDATLQRWLAALPAGLAGSRPRLLLAQARLALLSHRVEAAEVALDAADRALAGAAGVAGEPF